MRERAERKGELLGVPRLANERLDEIAAAHVMREIAEQTARERIVAKILYQAAAVRECPGAQYLVGGGTEPGTQ